MVGVDSFQPHNVCVKQTLGIMERMLGGSALFQPRIRIFLNNGRNVKIRKNCRRGRQSPGNSRLSAHWSCTVHRHDCYNYALQVLPCGPTLSNSALNSICASPPHPASDKSNRIPYISCGMSGSGPSTCYCHPSPCVGVQYGKTAPSHAWRLSARSSAYDLVDRSKGGDASAVEHRHRNCEVRDMYMRFDVASTTSLLLYSLYLFTKKKKKRTCNSRHRCT